jgi:hypothetical protein
MKSALGFFVVLLPFLSLAQDNSQANAYYFDDDEISSSRNIIKVDAISLIHGELPITLERTITRRFSVEGGLGILLPYYVHDFLPLIFDDERQRFTNNKFGSSVWLKAKLYEDRAPDLHYIDFTLHRRNFAENSVTDVSFGLGNQLIIGKRLAFDYGFGVGVRFQNTTSEEYIFDPDMGMTIIIPLQIKLGYLFN